MEYRISYSKSFVHDVRHSELPRKKQNEQISTFKNQNKISSLALIFSATTSMVGTGILVYPLLYKDNGMITSQLVVTIIGMISYKTASLCLEHSKSSEDDLSKTVKRQLGDTWQKVYCATGAVYLALTSGIYYLLILNTVYSQLEFVYNQVTGNHLTSKNIITFSTFSYQWTNFICILFFIVIVNLKSLKIVMLLGKYSFIGIIIFSLYCFTKSGINIQHLVYNKDNVPGFQIEEVTLFTSNIAVLAGSCAVAFNVHNMIVPIANQSVNPQHNQRDLKIVYAITFSIYSFIGVLGYLAILNITPNVLVPNTFMDYVPEAEIVAFIVDVFLLFKLCSITPLYVYLCKVQLFELMYPVKNVPWWATQIFNCSYLLFIGFLGYFNVTPTTIYAICGSYCGIVLIYAVPIYIHLTCIYRTPCGTVVKKSTQKSKGDTEAIDDTDEMLVDGGQNKISLLHKDKSVDKSYCESCDYTKINKNVRYVIYGAIMIFGLANSILVIISLAS